MWLSRLKSHIQSNIVPLLSCEGGIADAAIEVALPGNHVELEVVTVRHLTGRLADSFTAGTSKDDTSCTPQATPTNRSHDLLPEAPVLLMGILESSLANGGARYTGITLADVTGRIPCEVKEIWEVPQH